MIDNLTLKNRCGKLLKPRIGDIRKVQRVLWHATDCDHQWADTISRYTTVNVTRVIKTGVSNAAVACFFFHWQLQRS